MLCSCCFMSCHIHLHPDLASLCCYRGLLCLSCSSLRSERRNKSCVVVVVRRWSPDGVLALQRLLLSFVRCCLSLPGLKVVKQTVMTSVYGVTFVGARAQIQNVLGDKMIGRTDESGVSQSAHVYDTVCCLHLYIHRRVSQGVILGNV